MEKTPPRKIYNLKPPADPNKPHTPSKKCPNCKSRNIKVSSRRNYFLKFVVCTAIVAPYWLLLLNLKEDDIPEFPAGVMLLLILVLSVPVAVYGLYSFVRALLTKQTTYKCRYCKNRFNIPLLE